MLDIKFVRENLDLVERAMQNRNAEFDKDSFLKMDEDRRKLIAQEEELQAARNSTSKQIGQLMSQGKKDEAEEVKSKVREINEKLESAKSNREQADVDLKSMMMAIPNIPHETTPVGKDEDDNPEIRR